MNRKLKNRLTALSASGLLLAAALLTGDPAGQAGRAAPALAAGSEAGDAGSGRPRADRRGLALPYFSFARGVRRIGG